VKANGRECPSKCMSKLRPIRAARVRGLKSPQDATFQQRTLHSKGAATIAGAHWACEGGLTRCPCEGRPRLAAPSACSVRHCLSPPRRDPPPPVIRLTCCGAAPPGRPPALRGLQGSRTQVLQRRRTLLTWFTSGIRVLVHPLLPRTATGIVRGSIEQSNRIGSAHQLRLQLKYDATKEMPGLLHLLAEQHGEAAHRLQIGAQRRRQLLLRLRERVGNRVAKRCLITVAGDHACS